MLINQFLILGAVLFASASTASSPAGTPCSCSCRSSSSSTRSTSTCWPSRCSGPVRRAAAGRCFALFIIAVAAAEVGVGLAIVLLIYRNRRSISLDELSEMKG